MKGKMKWTQLKSIKNQEDHQLRIAIKILQAKK